MIVCVTTHLFRIIDSLIYHHSRLSCEKCGRATNIENRKSIGALRPDIRLPDLREAIVLKSGLASDHRSIGRSLYRTGTEPV